jgi:hypothetical protein
MVGMAVYIVRELKTSKGNKWKLGTLFAFGGLSVEPGSRYIRLCCLAVVG